MGERIHEPALAVGEAQDAADIGLRELIEKRVVDRFAVAGVALAYVVLGYVIAMIRSAGRELRAFDDGLRQGQKIARDEAEVSLYIK